MTVSHVARFVLAGCTAYSIWGTAQAARAEDFLLKSPAFQDGTPLAKKFANDVKSNPNCVGENISPPLQWSGVPAGTKSLAIIMYDPEARAGLGVVQWIAYGISPSVTGLAEGEASRPSDKFIGGKGTAGKAVYQGPCTPPGGGYHHYTFTLYATDFDPKALQPGLTRAQFLERLKGHGKNATGLVGLFTHPKS